MTTNPPLADAYAQAALDHHIMICGGRLEPDPDGEEGLWLWLPAGGGPAWLCAVEPGNVRLLAQAVES